MFAMAKVKLDTAIAEHEVLVKSIYRKLTGEPSCRLIGHHWENIGFQGTDPKTDIRGAGILGLVHILFFIDNFPKSSTMILKHSQAPKVEFPLAVKMFEYTILVLRLMREGRLYGLCNHNGNVLETSNQVYVSLFLRFMLTYIEGNHTLISMNDLNTQLESEARANIQKAIKG